MRSRAKNPDGYNAYMRAYNSTRRDQQREYGRTYRAAHRQETRAYARARVQRILSSLRALKLFRGCIDCGYNENADGLQFDHVRGQKIATITELIGNRDKMISEINKCEVRCATCHSIMTARRRAA